MHEEVSDATVLTVIISTFLLIVLGGIIVYFLFAYQKKSHRHQEEVLLLNEQFSHTLLLSKLEIREQTLDNISKELHANIGQLAAVVNMNLSTHLLRHKQDEHIADTKQLVIQMMEEIKNINITLNTGYIGKAGFQAMLEMELERLSKSGNYQVEFIKNGIGFRLSAEKEIILFRLCQELLNNIIRHAQATQINVQLEYQPAELKMLIVDNGVGFNLAEISAGAGKNKSTGIHNIYSRSKQINGSVRINSEPGKGTAVTVNIPV